MPISVEFDQFVGNSSWIQQVQRRILQVSDYHSNVLITGPSGTGKELIARAIHTYGPRRERTFIPVNCAAIPSGLFASQLFGHVKGAFTGAENSALGCFRAADGGSIFLDEIGDLDLDLQAKLLRVLQDREVVPVGSHESIPIDVRVIAATNRNLEEEVRQSRFRLDLYYRLNVVSIEASALKKRVADIEPLAHHYLAKAAFDNGLPLKTLAPKALQLLQAYEWPGNVRELQNLVERAVLFAEGDTIEVEAFPDIIRAKLYHRTDPNNLVDPRWHGKSPGTPAETEETEDRVDVSWPTLADVEREHIRKTLDECFYNQSAAARMLDVNRKLLARKVKKYSLEISSRRGRPRKK